MSGVNTTNVIARDERVCDYILPTKILLVRGKVNNADALLNTPQHLQIFLTEPDIALFENDGTGENAGILLDFGREFHGGVRLLAHRPQSTGPAYPRMLIRFGESASEAMTPLTQKNATNDHAVREMVVPLPPLSDQTWGQTGFRFVYLELLEPSATISLKSVMAAFIYRDIPYLGSFRCSDPVLNQIFDTAAYTCHLCLQSMLWDGVKRDRLVWAGDMHPEMLAIRSVFGDLPVMEQSLVAARDATPLPAWMSKMPAYSLWWLLTLHDWYFYNGRIALLEDNRTYILGLVQQVLNCINEEGELTLPSYFLDWPTDHTPDAYDGDVALTALALDAAVDMLRRLNLLELADKAAHAANLLRRNKSRTPVAKAAKAFLELADMTEGDTAAALLDEGARGVSTFMSYYIFKALAKTGRTKEAIDVMRTYFNGMLNMGATSFWEDFSIDWIEGSSPIDRMPLAGERDIHGDFGGYCYVGLRHSLCHGWASSPAAFLLDSVLGITFLEPGGTSIKIQPCLGDLAFAEGTYPIPGKGLLWVRVEQEVDDLKITCKAPEGVYVKY